ncbi:hypothetical protein E4T39_06613 [Aureobasidium subglaciale]|nr:hypothetical protein E4T39_06613 [Aureobasidium subglaciale]
MQPTSSIMSSAVNITPQPHSQKRKGGRAPLPEVEENFTRLPPGNGDRTERAVCKHCSKERSWHTTELVKHLDKCPQYTPSKRQKYTRPWRIERPGEGRSPNQPQSQQPSPQQLQNGNTDLTNRNVRVGPNGIFQWDGGMVAGRPSTTSNPDGRSAEDQRQQDGVEDGDQQLQPQPQPRLPQSTHQILHTPTQSVGGNANHTTAPNHPQRVDQHPQPPPNRQLPCPPPVSDPDQRLHSFIEYERGAMAYQNRSEDLDAIEAWLQHHRFDVEDIKEISETRWVDSWQLRLGDLYRLKRDVQTFKIFAQR